jgi:adenosylmethionine-8-amino-7-oxononanoate aminotransferase
VRPDLLWVGKGLSGGYLPLAATFATEEVFQQFVGPYEEYVTFFHGHTYTGNPLGCAAGLASLELFESERTVDNVRARAEALAGRLEREVASLAHVGDVRQRGLMVGIELVADRSKRTGYSPRDRVGQRVCLRARDEGVIIRPLGDVVVLMPPLAIRPSELDLLVDATVASIRAVTEGAGAPRS